MIKIHIESIQGLCYMKYHTIQEIIQNMRNSMRNPRQKKNSMTFPAFPEPNILIVTEHFSHCNLQLTFLMVSQGKLLLSLYDFFTSNFFTYVHSETLFHLLNLQVFFLKNFKDFQQKGFIIVMTMDRAELLYL